MISSVFRDIAWVIMGVCINGFRSWTLIELKYCIFAQYQITVGVWLLVLLELSAHD